MRTFTFTHGVKCIREAWDRPKEQLPLKPRMNYFEKFSGVCVFPLLWCIQASEVQENRTKYLKRAASVLHSPSTWVIFCAVHDIDAHPSPSDPIFLIARFQWLNRKIGC